MQDVSQLEQHLQEVIQLEHKADETNLKVMQKLSVVFITPIDRGDFYRLSCHLESCIDFMQGAIVRLDTFHIEQPLPVAADIMERIVEMTKVLQEIFGLLKDISRNEGRLLERAERLSRLESEVDRISRDGISHLFDGTQDLLDVIRWKDILGTLEDTADKVEELSNSIKEVTMKYA
ncbi:DUF47 domain-containing protein [Selenomonas bovis]|uniref:DUF47 domain-containing protein n=1 Tax=Selenomonas bovis TaxID=416586 RepID=UPI0003802AE9|nr:DUF47 family protein [Selenomonas bovis]